MTLLIVLAVLVAALAGVIVGAVATGVLPTVGEYRQVRDLAAEMQADRRIDELTRTTIEAMRAAVRQHGPSAR